MACKCGDDCDPAGDVGIGSEDGDSGCDGSHAEQNEAGGPVLVVLWRPFINKRLDSSRLCLVLRYSAWTARMADVDKAAASTLLRDKVRRATAAAPPPPCASGASAVGTWGVGRGRQRGCGEPGSVAAAQRGAESATAAVTAAGAGICVRA